MVGLCRSSWWLDLVILMISYTGGKNRLQMVVVCVTGRHTHVKGEKNTHTRREGWVDASIYRRVHRK